MNTNDVVVGGITGYQDEGLSVLCHLESELFGKHGSAPPAATAWAALAMLAALEKGGGVGVVVSVVSVRKNRQCGRQRVVPSAWERATSVDVSKTGGGVWRCWCGKLT